MSSSASSSVFAEAPLGGWRIGGIAAGTVCGYGISMCLLLHHAAAQEKIFAEHPGLSLEELVREKGEHYAPPLYLSFSHLRPDMGMQKRILKIGLPQAVEVFGMWGIQMFCLSHHQRASHHGRAGRPQHCRAH